MLTGQHRGYTSDECSECSKNGIVRTWHRLIEPPNHTSGTPLDRECQRCKLEEPDELEE